ncbi:hypothetical protein ACFLXP_03710 [Chloroflexota bacterium]
MAEMDQAHDRISSLTEAFRNNEAAYLSSAYIEAEAHKDFIDKFWIALGWDEIA